MSLVRDELAAQQPRRTTVSSGQAQRGEDEAGDPAPAAERRGPRSTAAGVPA